MLDLTIGVGLNSAQFIDRVVLGFLCGADVLLTGLGEDFPLPAVSLDLSYLLEEVVTLLGDFLLEALRALDA